MNDRFVELLLCLVQLELQLVCKLNGITETISSLLGGLELLIKNLDPDGFLKGLEAEDFEACGGGPVAVAMKVSKALGATETRVLNACSSGDVTGDKSSVVGYVSAIFGRAAV